MNTIAYRPTARYIQPRAHVPCVVQAFATSQNTAGANHTQWAAQLNGDTAHPVRPTRTTASARSPLRCAQVAAARPAASTSRLNTIHSHSGRGWGAKYRARNPLIDWLARCSMLL